MSYETLDQLVDEAERGIVSPLLTFTPTSTEKDVILFFAAWRKKAAVYPLNPRLPQNELEIRRTRAENANTTGFATLIETSSGQKVACHTYDALHTSAVSCAAALNITSHSKVCLNLPLFHISGIATLLRTFISGAHLTFNPYESTHISMVPTQLLRLEKPLPQCKSLLLGGAPPLPAALERARELSLPLYLTYGMTEIGSMAILKAPKQKATILPHVDLKIEAGEIHLRGPSLFHSYLGQERQEGWFATKDLGHYEDGELVIRGRKDRQFISGGENIQPEEIEAALCKLPGVIEAKVTPMPHSEYGQVPSALIYPKLKLEEIETHLEGLLPKFKIPKKIQFSITPLTSKSRRLQSD